MKMGALSALTGAGDKWLKIDYAAMTKGQTGIDLDKYLSQQSNDPSQMLQMLKEHATSVVEVGADDVRGVATTHYTATVDIAEAYRKSGAVVDDEKLADMLDQLDFGTPVSVTIPADRDTIDMTSLLGTK
jgi:hypothetical protein